MSASKVSALIEEVATLLRHDNLDSRIKQWLSMAYEDMVIRVPCWRFFKWTPISFVFSTPYSSTTVPEGEVVGAVFLLAGVPYFPRFVSWSEYLQQAGNQEGGGLASQTDDSPRLWSVGPDRLAYLYPVCSVTATLNVCQVRSGVTPQEGADYRIPVPYHLEHILVWGAAAIGARVLMPGLYPLFQAEYEQAIQGMTRILNYKPDSTPVLRSVMGPYAGTPTLNAPPRFPTNIPSP